jgi:hypothetical protein
LQGKRHAKHGADQPPPLFSIAPMQQPTDENRSQPLIVIMNWQAGLAK